MSTVEEKSWYDWAKEQTDPTLASQKLEALDNLLVMDLSHGNLGGMVSSSMLAELGAQVIRIEPPEGDVARGFSPFGVMRQDTGLGYLTEARNKRHITMNLKEPRAQEIFKTLTRQADIVIETFQPGVMDSCLFILNPARYEPISSLVKSGGLKKPFRIP